MTPAPSRGTPEGDATLAIRSLARATGQDVQDLMTVYALEGFLTRLGNSAHRADFVLKGGVLLAAFAARRPTKDIDLQATGLANEPEAVAARMAAIAGIAVADGLHFDPDSITASIIRDEDEYAGIRVSLLAHLGAATPSRWFSERRSSRPSIAAHPTPGGATSPTYAH
ncbi:MAG: nucleotidyl transferase AbiEii/AbiGii toxin family protein [Bifidobacteriaceae bacterium]|nr:nucleotidyl transferase AbiEii/AbiGii toxin family protein [Bifidobacteriaceae bacterium]